MDLKKSCKSMSLRLARFIVPAANKTLVCGSDVKSSALRPKFSPRPQTFGLGLEALASASNIWPRPGLDLLGLCNRAFFGQKSCKIREFC